MLFAGCAVAPLQRDAIHDLGQFEALATDERVRYEPGARDYAERGFHEGLASLAAGGGGADLVNEEEARRMVVAGSHFLPDERHDETRRKNGDQCGRSECSDPAGAP